MKAQTKSGQGFKTPTHTQKTKHKKHMKLKPQNSAINGVVHSISPISDSSILSVFYPKRHNGQYLFEHVEPYNEIPEGKSLCYPSVIDTEFKSFPNHWTQTPSNLGREGICTQMKPIKATKGDIFFHRKFAAKHGINRHHTIQTDFHPIDSLRLQGHDVSIERGKAPEGSPSFEFLLFAHFAIAEILLISEGDYRLDLLALFSKNSGKNAKLVMNRRLVAQTETATGIVDYIEPDWTVYLNGSPYIVRLSLVDTCAVHGVASYKDLAEAAGIELLYKDKLSQKDKENMDITAVERPEDFDNYSLGDLEVYDILVNNAMNYRAVYQSLGIEEFYTPPKLTIGSTVRDIFGATLLKHVGLGTDKKVKNQFEEKYLLPASAQSIRQYSRETKALLAKVQGGRCRNNIPILINHQGVLVDLDIAGAYGEGQRNQLYMLGVPEVVKWDALSANNEFWTLEQFLKEYNFKNPKQYGDLTPGAWFAVASSLKDLKHPQDFLASWFLGAKYGEKIMAKYVSEQKSDTEEQGFDDFVFDFNEEDGSLKIFNHQVYNSQINHDFLEWLFYVCSPVQRKELLTNLVVKAAMVYPTSHRVNSFEELEQAHQEHTGKNTVKRVGKGKKAHLRQDDGECHAWYGVNLGELIVNDLLANRKLYPKKTPLNTLFKLNTNTLYGDMVSKFFTSANVCVGNNITARCRALAWYMEKGLYGFQSITDGTMLDLNQVLFPLKTDRRITGENVVNLYSEPKLEKRQLKLAPLGGYDKITLDWIPNTDIQDKRKFLPQLTLVKGDASEILLNTDTFNWVNKATMQHLQEQFPNVSVLHGESTSLKSKKGEDGRPVKTFVPRVGQFEFEAKDFYDSATFHGTSNYRFVNPNGDVLKMRAYETKKHHDRVIDVEIGRYIDDDSIPTPAVELMLALKNDPTHVLRQYAFVKGAILKGSDYSNRQEHWDELGLVPGDSFYKPGLLREFSLSQFTYQTHEQYISWQKTYTRDKDKFEQSLEMYFINNDDTLNYERMITEVDTAIRAGVTDPVKHFDKSNHRHREDITHPQATNYRKVKEKLRTPEIAELYYDSEV